MATNEQIHALSDRRVSDRRHDRAALHYAEQNLLAIAYSVGMTGKGFTRLSYAAEQYDTALNASAKPGSDLGRREGDGR